MAYMIWVSKSIDNNIVLFSMLQKLFTTVLKIYYTAFDSTTYDDDDDK